MTTEFSDDQFDQAYPDGIENHWWILARNRIVTSVIKKIVGAVVLDVGLDEALSSNICETRG